MVQKRKRQSKQIRSSLRISTVEGSWWAVMYGMVETYFGAFFEYLKYSSYEISILSTLPIFVGAVFQREIMERRYGPGPEYLAMELAYPQGLRRGLVAVISFFFAVNWSANNGQHDFIIGCAWFIAAWASYGVYRTVRSAKAEPTVDDVM